MSECALDLEMPGPPPGYVEHLTFLNVPVFMACVGAWGLVLLVATRIAALF
jgi:hypothetical protein